MSDCKFMKFNLVGLILVLFILGAGRAALGQDVFGLSVGYESFPSVVFADSVADPSGSYPEPEMQTQTLNLGLAMPLIFADGKIIVLNKLAYQRTDFAYEGLPPGQNLERAHSIRYNITLIDSLSEKWTLLAIVTPGLASDFEGDLAGDDVTLEMVFGYIRTHSSRLKLGYGLAYRRDFGNPMALPFIYFDWNNGARLHASGIFPMNMTLVYSYSKQLDLGIAFLVNGNSYHGDPDTYGVDNPQLVYSEATIAPSIRVHMNPMVHLNVEGGFAFYRNYDFLDGDESAGDFNLEPSTYLRARLILGM